MLLVLLPFALVPEVAADQNAFAVPATGHSFDSKRTQHAR